MQKELAHAGRDRRGRRPRRSPRSTPSSSPWPSARSRAILTNDFNLNRVAELQGVRVLNINSLANAVKPAVLPGRGAPGPGHPGGQGGGPGRRLPRRRHDDRRRGRRPLHRPGARRRGHPRPPDGRRPDDLRPAAARLSDRRGPGRVGARRHRRRGRRVEPDGRRPDKLAAPIGGRPLLAWTLDALAAAPEVGRIVVVTVAPSGVAERGRGRWLPAARRRRRRRRRAGARNRSRPGSPRFDRARRPDDDRVVLVHDGARPLVEPATRRRASPRRRRRHGAAIPVVPVAETVKRIDGELVGETVDRTGLGAAQTPQGVRAATSCATAWRRFPADGPETFTDEAALLEACSIPVHAIPGDPGNLKVTLPGRSRARRGARRSASTAATPVRIGHRARQPSVRAGRAARPRRRRRSPARPRLRRPLRRRRRPPRGRRRAARGGRAGRPRAPVPGRRPDAARHRQRATLLDEVRRRVAAAGWRPASVDLTIVAARPRLAAHLDAMRDRDRRAARARPARGQRQGLDRQPRRRRRAPVGSISALGRRPTRARPRPMTLRLHDTLSGETRPLVPLDAGPRPASTRCGPTVYGPAHIGNFRSFLFADLLVRYLRWRGPAR